MSSSDSNLITFKAISNFVNELSETFEQRSLKLYKRLINQTTLAHDIPIQKHVDAFKEFCVQNRDAITSKDSSKIIKQRVEYSERVFINFSNIFSKADTETTSVIWNHLLTISALVDPSGNAKKILLENTTGNEADFLSGIIDKVGEHVRPDANPMEAVMALVQSGVVTDLIGNMNSGLQNGTFDIRKLMGAATGMMSTFADKAGDNKGTETIGMVSSMLSNMMGGLNNDGPSDQIPDISALLGPLMAGLAGGGGLNEMMNGRNNGSINLEEEMSKITSGVEEQKLSEID